MRPFLRMLSSSPKSTTSRFLCFLLLTLVINAQVLSIPPPSALNSSMSDLTSQNMDFALIPVKKIAQITQNTSQTFTSIFNDTTTDNSRPVNVQAASLKQVKKTPQVNQNSTASKDSNVLGSDQNSSQTLSPSNGQNYGKLTLYQLAYTLVYLAPPVSSNSTSNTAENILKSSSSSNSMMNNTELQAFNTLMATKAKKLSDQLLGNSQNSQSIPNSSSSNSNTATPSFSPSSQLAKSVSANYDQSIIDLKQQINNQFDSFF